MKKAGIQTLFFAGNKEAFTKELFDYSNSIKTPFPVGESPVLDKSSASQY